MIIQRPGTRTVATRIYVRAGSRYDDAYPGTAHFLEHMLFKGSLRHSPAEIFSAIEAQGGEINAGTGREYISLHTVTLAQDLPQALDLLADILIQPALKQNEFEREKPVILQEAFRAENQPAALYDLFINTLWQGSPLSSPILGTHDSLEDLKLDVLQDFHHRRFVSGNTIIVICGDMEIDRASNLTQAAFADFPFGPVAPPEPIDEYPLNAPRLTHLQKEISQTHLLLGASTCSMKHPDRSALKLIELALGMGGSGRLYRCLREESGLVYNINTISAWYEDAGFLGMRAICSPENGSKVRQAILKEWGSLQQTGIDGPELAAVKGNYVGTLARRFETNLAVAGIFGIEALLHEIETFEQAVARIQSVTPQQIIQAAEQYLDPERFVCASLGPQQPG